MRTTLHLCLFLALFFLTSSSAKSQCTTTVSTFDAAEGYEGFAPFLFNNVGGDNFNWTVNSGTTPTTLTGPSSAHGGSEYIYTETSSIVPFTNQVAILESPCLALPANTIPYLNFWLHMEMANTSFTVAQAMGNLTVQVNTNPTSGSTWTTLATYNTSNANWLEKFVDLSNYAGQTIKLRLRAQTGTGTGSTTDQAWAYGDRALDDILISKGVEISHESCPGAGDGTIQLDPHYSASSSATYSYVWSTGATSSSLSSLAGGNYTVTITDNLNVSKILTLTVNSGNIPAPQNLASSLNAFCSNTPQTATLTIDYISGDTIYDGFTSVQSDLGTVNSAGSPMNFTLTGTPAVATGDGTLTMFYRGDMEAAAEYVTTYSENGSTIGATTPSSGQCSGTYNSINFTLPVDSINVWAQNGSIGLAGIPTGMSRYCSLSGSFFSWNAYYTLTYPYTSIVPYWFENACGSNIASAIDTGFTISVTPTATTTYYVRFYDPACNAWGACDSVTITVNTPPTVSVTPNSATYCNTAVNLTASGASTYAWAPGTGLNATTGASVQASPAASTIYTVTGTDVNSCTNTASASITVSAGPTATITSTTPVSCYGGSNGAATVSASGGSGSYTYLWSNNATTASISGLTAGNYTVTVSDGNCTNTATATVSGPFMPLTIFLFPNNIACSGFPTGSIFSSVGGGTSGYSRLWSTGSTATNIFGLTAGTYTLTVTDANGCTASADTVITAPTSALSAAITSTSNVTCFGGNNGSATVTASGGTPAYSYAWSNGQTTATATGLTAGTYFVTVTDGNGCIAFAATAITQPATGVSASITSSTNVSCFGGNNGSATASASGGAGSISYAWSNGATAATASGLAAGAYTVTATDAGGCTDTETITITQPAAISATFTVTNVGCSGGTNGTVTASGNGGSGSFASYTWSNGATGTTITGLAAGSYTVTVTDNSGCTGTATATVTQPAVLSVSVTGTNAACNGSATGSATASATGGTTPYTYSWSNGATTATAAGLAAGTYTVTSTDAMGCTDTESIVITQPVALAASASATAALCNGGNSGSATASVTGGTTPYSYTWSSGATTATAAGLAAGTYTVTVTDFNGCTTSATTTVTQPTAVIASITFSANATCNGGSNGSATASATGGTGSKTFAWSNGATGTTASGLAAGTYTVTATDANGCTDTETVAITAPSAVVASITSTNTNCSGSSTGTATASATGGTGSKTFAWSTGATTAAITGLAAGSYTVTATDANGCTDTETATITQPTPVVTSITAGNVSCNGGNDGTATASSTGGTSPYSYNWNTGATGSIITGLATGTYTVTATDANGCTDTETVSITQPTSFTASASATNVSCNGGNNGSATATPTGGTSPYSYLWNNGSSGATASNLVAGTYTVTITDANGCTATASATLTQPATAITVSASSTNVTCNDGSNGTATAVGSGGTGSISYTWSSGATTAMATGLVAGTFTVTATDASGCTATASVTVTQPSAITIPSLTVVNTSCNGGSNGSLTANPSGGTPGYTYNWSNGATSQNITGLATGTYTVTVTDAGGCTASLSGTVTQPAAITIGTSVTNITCNGGANGSITATATGGTGAKTYTWNTGATGATISGLSTGTYTVTATDANGCTATTSASITQPSSVIASVSASTGPGCNGGNNGTATASGSGGTAPYSFTWSSGATTAMATGLAAGTYTVTLSDAGGCTDTETVTISEPTVVVAAITSTDVSCNGGSNGSAAASASGGTGTKTFTWSTGATTATITGLAAGTYTVTATDANGCTDTESVTISQPSAVAASISSTNVSCNGGTDGSATASASGGTGSKTFNWNSGATTATITGLGAGTYTVTATDANGCTGTAMVTITQPASIGVTVATTTVSCNGGTNGSATASTSGGAAPYSYAWSNGASGAAVSGLAAGTYTTTVTDANGCTDSETFTITQPVALAASIASSVDVSCNGGFTGSATASATGGVPSYSYSWSNGASGITATGLNAGTHTVTVTDANGCTSTASAVILQPSAISLSVTINNQVSCNGGTNGSATATATGGISPYFYTWSNGSVGATVSGLAAGTYTATVTDVNLCTSTQSFTINQPTAVVASIAIVLDASCYGEASGGIASQVTGGTTSYSYLWSTGSISANLVNVPSGTYTLTVTDAQGCTDTAEAFVDQPDSLSLSATVTGISCNGAADGIIAVSATGGTPTYSYYWSTGSFSNSDSNLSAGTYTITVGDLNDCFKSFSINLSDPAILTSSIVLEQDAACGGDSTAMAVVAGSGGTLPYTYQWSAGVVTNDDTLQNIPAGMYVVTLTDANGCNITDTATLSEPAPLVLTLDSAADVTCAGGSNGYAAVSVSGGAGGYTYLWTDGGSSAIRNNLAAGTQCITVTDANGCTNSLCVTITELNGLPSVDLGPDTLVCGTSYILDAGAYASFQWNNGQTGQNINVSANGNYAVTVTDINGCQNSDAVNIGFYLQLMFSVNTSTANCGMSDGQATIANLSGGGGYTINWSTGQTGGLIANNLSFGSYNVMVTDQNGCSHSETFLIGNNSSLSASATAQDALCNGEASGQATITASAGIPPYSFTWSNGSAGSVVTGLNAGTYYVTVEDSAGCQVFDTAVIGEPAAIAIAVASSASACGDSTGSASVTGITPPGSYTYLWSDPLAQTTATATNLPAGTYNITVTDANGCTGTAPALVSDNNAPSIAMGAVNESCQGSGQGSATATASGSGPFTYLWNDGLNQTTATASNLGTGLYFVTVTDVNGCMGIDSISVGYDNATPYVSLGNDTSVCANFYVLSPGSGYTAYQWNTGSSNASISVSSTGMYTITVTDANGCTNSASINLVLFPPIAVMSNVINSYCSVSSGSVDVTVLGGGGTYSFLWSTGDTTATISGLGAGNYDLSITDNNGCMLAGSYTVGYINGPALAVTASDATCFGAATGSASTTVSAGNPPYSYNWSNGETGNAITALAAGSYDITLTDDSGCVVVEPFIIAEAPEMTVSISSTAPMCGTNNGSAQASVSNNQGPLSYLWDDPANTMSASVSGLFAGFYTVEVIDSAGCTASGSMALSDSGAATLITGATDNNCADDDQGNAFVQAIGNAPFTYLWNDALAQTNDTATQLITGTYAVSVSDANGCIAIGTATVGYFNALPVIDLGADITACVGEEVILTPGGGFATYFWTTGATTPSVTATMSQTYDVSVTDFNGCAATDTVDVSFIAPPVVDLGSDTVVCNDHSQPSLLLDAGSGFTTYLWSTNATSQTINVSSSGIYKVTVSNTACYGSDQVIVVFDSCINVNTEEIAGNAAPVLLLYPNPNLGQFTIETAGLSGGRYTLRIMNASGQAVMHHIMNVQQGIGSRDEFDLKAMPAGVYVITLEGENLRMDRRVIIQ